MSDINLDICSFNCNGLGDHKKRKDIFDFLRSKKYSIFLLQETHLTFEQENFIRSCWGFEVFCAGNSTNSNGVAILFSNNFEYKLHNCIRDPRGRFILLDLEICQKRVSLLNVYGPSIGDNVDFFIETDQVLQNQTANKIIIGGDWNCTLSSEDCKFYVNSLNRPNTREKIKELMAKYNLIDIWRVLNPLKNQYTWRKFNANKRARLDYFLISEDLQTEINNCTIDIKYKSDHSIITISLKKEGFKHGKSYWKFNNSLLKNEGYIKEIKEVIAQVKKDYCIPIYNLENINNINNEDLVLTIRYQLFLDLLLMKIRLKTISFSSNLHRLEKERYQYITNKIMILEDRIDEVGIKEELEILNNELLEIRTKKIEGMNIRSRTNWLKEGERGSRYFCSLEKRNFINKSMPFLELENGERIYDQKLISEEVKCFYENLYKEQHVEETNLNNILPEDTPKLSEDQKNDLSGKLTLQELAKALQNMKNNKSPGSDGFTVEFFKFFFRDLGFYLLQSLNEGFENGELSASQKQGIIVCIPKENKPKMFLKNWRPITLLNITYKLGSSILANRLKQVLPSIINNCQKGFLKGRYIGENIRLIYDLMIHTEINNIPGLLMSIDYQKAFDSISWKFIEQSMDFFNFGDTFIGYFKTMYKNANANIFINGQYSSRFNVNRGVRQGDPCSPYFYLIGAEILSIMLRCNEDIKGITIENREFVLSQFADDTALCLDGSEASFRATVETLDKFSAFSGLIINNEKTQLMWLGSRRDSRIKYMRDRNFTWDPGIITILGIKFSPNIKEIVDINYQNKIYEIEKLLIGWRKRSLTPYGKITVIKTLIIPKILYLFINIPDPSTKFLTELEKILFGFLWNKKPNKIRSSTIKLDYKEGGLNMIDIKAFLTGLKISWLKRLKHNKDFYTKTTILCPKIKIAVNTGGEVYKNITIQNQFWTDVLKHYGKLGENCLPRNSSEFISEFIFYNKNLVIGNKPIFIKPWYDLNIVRIGDLLDNQGQFMTLNVFRTTHPTITINFITYHGIIQCIRQWANKLEINLDHRDEIGESTLWKTINEGNSAVRKSVIPKQEIHNALTKWNNLFIGINWNMLFKRLHTISLDNKLKWLQIRIFYRIIPTNRLLKLQRIKESELCTFCQGQTETIQHLFWACIHVNAFWQRIEDRIKDTCATQIHCNFSERLVILGCEGNVQDIVLELIILYGKYFIYLHKLQDTIPTFCLFMHFLKSKIQLEKWSKSPSNLDIFCDKLEPYKNFLL